MGLSYFFVFNCLPIPEGVNLVDPETKEVNQGFVSEAVFALSSRPPLFQIILNKDSRLTIQDLYNCVLQGYKDTADSSYNENLGIALDALKNLVASNKRNLLSGLPDILSSAIEETINEKALGVGSVVDTETHICFLRLTPVPSLFLPSSETKLSEQDNKA